MAIFQPFSQRRYLIIIWEDAKLRLPTSVSWRCVLFEYFAVVTELSPGGSGTIEIKLNAERDVQAWKEGEDLCNDSGGILTLVSVRQARNVPRPLAVAAA